MYLCKSFPFLLSIITVSTFTMEPNVVPDHDNKYEQLQLLVAQELFVYLIQDNQPSPTVFFTKKPNIQLLVSLQRIINSPLFQDVHKDFFTYSCPFDTYKDFAIKKITDFLNKCPIIYSTQKTVLALATLMFPEPDPQAIYPTQHLINMLDKIYDFPENDIKRLMHTAHYYPLSLDYDPTINPLPLAGNTANVSDASAPLPPSPIACKRPATRKHTPTKKKKRKK